MKFIQKEIKEVKETPKRQRNRVIVKIWSSGENLDRPGANVGHASIQIEDSLNACYFSLWPEQARSRLSELSAKEEEGSGFFSGISHEFPTYETDVTYEGRVPEYIFCFYSLDTAAVFREIEKLKKELTGWCLLGRFFCDNVESCASSVWRILLAGGIKKLTNSLETSTQNSKESSRGSGQSRLFYSFEHVVSQIGIQSPDALITQLKLSKEEELKSYEWTRGETYISSDGVPEWKSNSELDLYYLL